MRHATLIGLLGATAMGAAACRDTNVGAPPADVGIVLPRGGAQAVIEQDTSAHDGTTTFIVRVQTRDATVSSFQGSVTFKPGSFMLVSATTPQGQGGENYLINSAGFNEGRIRFAALTTTKFMGTDTGNGAEALRFTVNTLHPVSESGLIATLDVVGSDAGKALSADRLLPSAAIKIAAFNTVK